MKGCSRASAPHTRESTEHALGLDELIFGVLLLELIVAKVAKTCVYFGGERQKIRCKAHIYMWLIAERCVQHGTLGCKFAHKVQLLDCNKRVKLGVYIVLICWLVNS